MNPCTLAALFYIYLMKERKRERLILCLLNKHKEKCRYLHQMKKLKDQEDLSVEI